MGVSGKFFLLLFSLLFLSGTALAETLDKIVATVNGEIILHSELRKRVASIETASPEIKPKDSLGQAELEREVLQSLIRDRLAEAEIRRLKISVSKREVDATIEGIKEDNEFNDAQLTYILQQSGKTLDQFRDEIKKQLEQSRLLDRVLKSKTVITEEQVDAFIKSGQSISKERHHIALIFLPASDDAANKQAGDAEKLAREIHSRLKGGADFARMAREYSKGPAAQEGGDIGHIASDELAPAIGAAVSGLKADEITDVVKAAGGYYIIKVLDVQKEKQSSSDPNMRQKIRKELMQQELNRKYEEWVKELESRAFIQISL